ncbi:MAG: NAD-dependent succinate-semialdehyde dehydrogenase [Gammaproteobacteria bacterium]
MSLQSINPANGQVIQSYTAMSDAEVDAIIDEVSRAGNGWRNTDFSIRADLLKNAAKVLRSRKAELSRLMVAEMGKTYTSAEGEVDKCAWVCDFYAEHGEEFLAPEPISSDASLSKIVYNPLGTVLAVMPWNFPFWQVFRFAAPGLMAGNTGLLKHASNVSGCALAIEEIFAEAGFPNSVFRTLLISSDKVERVIENPAVAAVTLTGSTPAGRAVAGKAGQCLKKTVLELGGTDPYLVLADADMALAVETCVNSRLINAGQSCIAAKRFIVVQECVDEFTQRFTELMASKKMGEPSDPDSDLGPQAREDLRDDLHKQVTKSVAKGAKLLLGGEIPDGPGAFYPPTVLGDVTAGMPAYDDELFGPVAAIITATDEADAIRIANDSNFGLGAAVFTRDTERGEFIAAEQLQAGACFVNSLVKSDPRLPFGGIKNSGYGRELSHLGIREFVNTKTVYVA